MNLFRQSLRLVMYDNSSPLAPVLRNNKIVKASKNPVFRLDRIGRIIK